MNGLNCESKNKLNRVNLCIIVAVVSVLVTVLVISVIVFNVPGMLDLIKLDFYVDRYFYGEQNNTDIENGILSGYINGLDDKYAMYLDGEMTNERDDRLMGSSKGLGIYVTKHPDEEAILVTEIFDNSPADDIGILKGDIIISVDGTPVSEVGYTNAFNMFAREVGDEINVTVRRDDKELFFKAVYSDLVTQTVFYEKIQDFGYIKILSFNNATSTQFSDAVDTAVSDECNGLIFDLRGNGGGTLASVEIMLNYILPEGETVFAKYPSGKIVPIARSDEKEVDLPMAVLTDKNTASASEIFASNIVQFKKGITVGERTFGKGVMQNSYRLTEGKSAVFTIAEVLTHNKTAYHGEGISPNIEVILTEEENKYINLTPIAKDRVVNSAVEWLNGVQNDK